MYVVCAYLLFVFVGETVKPPTGPNTGAAAPNRGPNTNNNHNNKSSNGDSFKGPTFTLYVNQLPENVTAIELRTLFSTFGAIRAIDVIPDKAYAFVKFETHAGLLAALEKK